MLQSSVFNDLIQAAARDLLKVDPSKKNQTPADGIGLQDPTDLEKRKKNAMLQTGDNAVLQAGVGAIFGGAAGSLLNKSGNQY